MAVLGAALLWIPKAELHLMLCDRHTRARDTLYMYYTQAGEWVPYVVCLLLLFYRAGWAVFTAAGTALSGLMTQILKRIIDAPRPLTWFAANCPDVQLPLVEGVRMSHFHSFPSGHTTTFFALFFALCLIGTEYFDRRRNALRMQRDDAQGAAGVYRKIHSQSIYVTLGVLWQVMCFCLAALGGYSRIYLSQHFTADVLAGMCVGLLITGLLYALLRRFEGQKWWKWHFFQKKLR